MLSLPPHWGTYHGTAYIATTRWSVLPGPGLANLFLAVADTLRCQEHVVHLPFHLLLYSSASLFLIILHVNLEFLEEELLKLAGPLDDLRLKLHVSIPDTFRIT